MSDEFESLFYKLWVCLSRFYRLSTCNETTRLLRIIKETEIEFNSRFLCITKLFLI